MEEEKRLVLIIGLVSLVSLMITFLFLQVVGSPGMPRSRYFESFFMMKIFISTLNVFLIIFLILNYFSIYKDMPNRFTLSLIIFSIALLLYALSSNPFLPLLFGFRHGVSLGPFAFIPDMFATAAVTILLYQSYKF